MSRLALAFAIALAIPVSARAQRPVWVYLRPEAVQSGAIVKGIRERPALENDRAIPASLVKKIARTGAHVRTTSRWLQAVSVDADATEIARLARMKEVRAIVPVAQLSGQAPRTAVRVSVQSAQRADMLADFDSAFYGLLWKGIKMLDVAPSHAIGFTGKLIRIAIFDTGFNPTHQSLATRTIVGQKDLINNDANVRDQPGDVTIVGAADQEQHGTWVWSVLGGYAPGTLVGPAFDATFLLASRCQSTWQCRLQGRRRSLGGCCRMGGFHGRACDQLLARVSRLQRFDELHARAAEW